MNIIGLLLGNFLLFTLYACTPSLFKPTVKIAYSRWIFAEILERCTWPMSMSANKSRKWKICIALISLLVFILKILKEKTEKKHIQYRWLGKKSYQMMAEKVAVRSTKIFWSKLEKKAPKKEKKHGQKRRAKQWKSWHSRRQIEQYSINMTSELCCVIWIINKRAHCVQLK